ncbi:MAG: cbb3-type cytochrome c oxidase subunit I, partial [Acidimicrobiia bacterium]
IVPSDYQQTDTYYIVAHFHYVLFGGAIFGLVSGAYYWAPVVTGKLLDEKLGTIHFWLMLIGFNLAFGPMHILGMQGQPRRTYQYPTGMGWDFWNLVSTIGAMTIALSFLVFIVNIFKTMRSPERSPADPWDARTLEWTIPHPPPEYNFAEIPVVHGRDDFWHRKYTEDDTGRLVRIPAGGSDQASSVTTTTEHDGGGDGHDDGGGDGHGDDHGHGAHGHGIHMPSPSYFPALAAVGIMLVGYGGIYLRAGRWWIMAIGGLIALAGIFGWGNEPLAEEH